MLTAVVKVTPNTVETVAPFDANLFLTVLLPIIVFEAGFSTNRVRGHAALMVLVHAAARAAAHAVEHPPAGSATFSATWAPFRCWRWWAL